MLAALFTSPTKPHVRAKMYESRRIIEGKYARARKNDRTDLEATMRAFFIDEETHQMRDRKLATAASSSRFKVVERSTSDGAVIVMGTTEGDLSTDDVAGS